MPSLIEAGLERLDGGDCRSLGAKPIEIVDLGGDALWPECRYVELVHERPVLPGVVSEHRGSNPVLEPDPGRTSRGEE